MVLVMIQVWGRTTEILRDKICICVSVRIHPARGRPKGCQIRAWVSLDTIGRVISTAHRSHLPARRPSVRLLRARQEFSCYRFLTAVEKMAVLTGIVTIGIVTVTAANGLGVSGLQYIS